MLEQLEPLKSGNGLVGKYSSRTRQNFFSVMLTENMDSVKRAESLADVQMFIVTHRRINGSQSQRFGAPPIQNDFMRPEEITLSSDLKKIPEVVREKLRGNNDIIFICPNKRIYVEACATIGITRADHLACAEMHSVLSGKTSDKKYVAGKAHILRDRLIRATAFMQRLPDDHRMAYYQKVSDEFIDNIPTAVKFQLGRAKFYIEGGVCEVPSDLLPKLDKPWLYKLPFKKCLFEVEIPLDPKKEESKGRTFGRAFILAQEDEPDVFSAQIIEDVGFDFFPAEFFVMWDVSGRKADIATQSYHGAVLPEYENYAWQYIWSFLPALEKLNDMRSEIQHILPPAEQRFQVGKFKRSPYYDYHVIIPEPREDGSEPSEHEAEPRRLHSRRGHWRTYTHPRYTNLLGQRKWIDAKFWGDENQGALGKEYNLTQE